MDTLDLVTSTSASTFLPRRKMTAEVATPITFVKPKVVEKAFTLPLVTDTYTYLATTSAPLQPYMDTAVTAVSPVVETSFTLAQVVLKASDAGLETTNALLKLVPGEQAVPVKEGVRRLRAEATAVRKEGAKRNGTEQVAALEDATLVEAVAAILGITWIH